MENKFTQKIPLHPPLLKEDATKKDAGQAGMTKIQPKNLNNF
jgi:hypothetical protein